MCVLICYKFALKYHNADNVCHESYRNTIMQMDHLYDLLNLNDNCVSTPDKQLPSKYH